MRLFFLFGLAALPALAQTLDSCKAAPSRETAGENAADPVNLFLRGRELQSTDMAGAIDRMQEAAAKDPRFPWPRLALAEFYLMPKFRDEAKAIDSLKAYIQICPYNLEAYVYLRAITDHEFAAEGARRLRYLLGEHADAPAIPLYPTLWNTELRLAAADDLGAARARISSDLERLKLMDAGSNPALALVEREGRRLLSEPPPASPTLARPAPAPENAAQAVRDWNKEHPRPASADRAAQKRYGKALLKAADEWVKKYPGEFTPLHERFVALELAEASRSELEAAGDALIRTGDSARVHVAEVWLRHDIRVSEIPDIVEKTMEREQDHMRGWAVMVEAYLKLDKPFKARELLRRMQDWLGESKNARASTFPTHQARYYLLMARLAEKENSKLDALTYYERAIATRRVSAAEVEKAHAAWKDMGGTNEGWLVFSTPPAAAATPGLTAPRVTSRADVGKPLPAMTLKDFDGKTWTLASFQGKMTLINVWATWCGPCQKELPHLQKLYDKIKDQADVQVLTLNVDEEIGLVQPYLRKYKYTFPVLQARAYIHTLLPNLSIPRNWIVDRQGLMREETIGFGGSGNQWIENALAKLKE